MTNLYYQSSGKAPVPGILTAILGGAVGAILLAIVYIALQWFIPFIYLNLFICIFLGLGLGVLISFLIKTGKIRSKKTAFLIAIIVALVAFYAQWALFVSLMLDAEGGGSFYVKSSFNLDTFFMVLTHPKLVIDTVFELNEIGTINIKHNVISGVALWVIWLIEAGIILILPVIIGPIRAGHPFSETNNAWMGEDKKGGPLPFIEDTNALKADLEAGRFEVLDALKAGEASKDKYTTITTYTLPGEIDNYISIDHITVSLNSKGEEKKKTDNVVKYKWVPASVIGKLS